MECYYNQELHHRFWFALVCLFGVLLLQASMKREPQHDQHHHHLYGGVGRSTEEEIVFGSVSGLQGGKYMEPMKTC